jgi:hypothetical protein
MGTASYTFAYGATTERTLAVLVASMASNPDDVSVQTSVCSRLALQQWPDPGEPIPLSASDVCAH